MVRGLLLVILLIAAPAAAEQPFAPATAGQRVIYSNATVIDGTGGAPQPGMAVIVNGERIEEVLPAARLTPQIREGARIVDVTGLYLLPGLIDSHQHLATPPDRTFTTAKPVGRSLLVVDSKFGFPATAAVAKDRIVAIDTF